MMGHPFLPPDMMNVAVTGCARDKGSSTISVADAKKWKLIANPLKKNRIAPPHLIMKKRKSQKSPGLLFIQRVQ